MDEFSNLTMQVLKSHFGSDENLAKNFAYILLKRAEVEAAAEREKTPSGYVYFLWDGKHCKIGHSIDPRGRASILKIGNQGIRLLGFVKAAHPKLLEKQLHEEFHGKWTGGEWFELTREEALEKLKALKENYNLMN